MTDPTPTKRCTKCGEYKTLDFYKKHKNTRDGLTTWCRTCFSAYSLDYYHRHPEKWLHTQRKSRYGVTAPQVEAMEKAQDGCCFLCGKKPKGQFHVDHDHVTGRARLLLCSKCNQALGMFDDSPERMRLAADYIERFREQDSTLTHTSEEDLWPLELPLDWGPRSDSQ